MSLKIINIHQQDFILKVLTSLVFLRIISPSDVTLFSGCWWPKSLQRNYIQHEHLNSQTFWNTNNGGITFRFVAGHARYAH